MEVCCVVSGKVEDGADGASPQRGASPGAVQSVERAAQILRLLGHNGRQGITELAVATGLSKGTVHSLLQTLASSGLVQHDTDTGRYGLGPLLVYLGSRYLRDDDVRVCASRWARLLAKETNQVVQVGTLYGLDVLIVNHVGRGEDSVHVSDLGSLYPAHTTAVGKVLLAHHDGGARDSFLGFSDAHQTASDRVRLQHELTSICKQGWAVAGARVAAHEASVACPILSRRGEVVGAIGVVGVPEQLLVRAKPRAGLLERVRSASVAVSHDLGGPGW
jgi:DNA-binding IclR family transcriptional regulator